MWNPVKIKFSNLFAHRKSEYVFKNGLCTVIFGKNETDRGVENNGAGKTTLFEAICIALTNESLRAIKKDAFINRDEESAVIEFELRNDVLKQNLKIIRQFYRGSRPVKVEIWENGELNAEITSVNEANRRIIDLIGITRDDLLRYFIISQDNSYTFFTASDGDKKEIMNRITSADMVNPILDELSDRLKKKEQQLALISSNLNAVSSRRDTLAEQLEEARNPVDKNERRDELKRRIDKTVEDEETVRNELRKTETEIFKTEAKAEETTPVDTDVFRKKIKDIEGKIESLEEEQTDDKRLLKKIEIELEGEVVCPSCGENFIPSCSGVSPDELKDAKTELNDKISSLKKKIDGLAEKKFDLKSELKAAEITNSEIDNLKSRLRRLKNQKLDFESTIETILKKRERLTSDLRELENDEGDKMLINSLYEKIADCDKQCSELEKELQTINSDLEIIKFWNHYMGKSGFVTYLANQSIKIIEGTTNSYLRKFGTDLSVIINGFKILKSGEIREKIDIFVTSDGVTAESYLSKSGGERGRINLAGILGIQRLINISTNGRGLNLLLLDEVFPGVDPRGQENIIRILETLGITVMMITQNVSDGFNNENTLWVVKRKGESKFINGLEND